MTRVAIAGVAIPGVLYPVCYTRSGYNRCTIPGGLYPDWLQPVGYTRWAITSVLYPMGYTPWAMTGRLVRWYAGTGNYSHQLLLVCTLFVIDVLALYGDESTS